MSGFDFSNFTTAPKCAVETVTEVKEVAVKDVKKVVVEDKKDNVVPINKSKPITKVDAKNEVVRISSIMRNIKEELSNSFIEREHEVELLSIAFVSETNAFLHGVPGTGKSDLVESFSNRFTGCNYFRMLMSKTTEPSEIFGPVSINSLKEDKYRVITDGKLPQADIAFLDETFKANSASLNGLLTIMNEKVFYNDVKENVPLISIVGASNEFPEEDGLEALYDRFLLRWNVEPIRDVNNRTRLFKKFLNRRNKSGIVHNDNVDNVDKCTTLPLEDLKKLSLISRNVTMSDTVLDEYNKLFTQLEKEGITVSDRRKNEAIKTIQAHAVLDGRLEADVLDFSPLMYCFWNELNDIKPVVNLITKISAPDNGFGDEYKKSLDDLKIEVDDFVKNNKSNKDYEIAKAAKLVEVKKKLSFAIDKIDAKIDSIKGESVKDKLKSLRKEYEDYSNKVTDMLV